VQKHKSTNKHTRVDKGRDHMIAEAILVIPCSGIVAVLIILQSYDSSFGTGNLMIGWYSGTAGLLSDHMIHEGYW